MARSLPAIVMRFVTTESDLLWSVHASSDSSGIPYAGGSYLVGPTRASGQSPAIRPSTIVTLQSGASRLSTTRESATVSTTSSTKRGCAQRVSVAPRSFLSLWLRRSPVRSWVGGPGAFVAAPMCRSVRLWHRVDVVSWVSRRWAAGRLSLVIGVLLAVFTLVVMLLPQNGCGPAVVEVFGNNFGSTRISERTIASYDCRSIARSALPFGAVVGLVAAWFVIAPSLRERDRRT